jgi:murein DD-endopeptidase MepM/ murein hydrolase activator NlpD
VAALPWLDLGIYAIRLACTPAPVALSMPIANLKRGAMTDTWQAARGPRRRHEGIDMFAAKGAPIVAATEGIVIGRGQDPLGGNVLWVLGPGGQRHYYAHLDRFSSVGVGDRVGTGTLLGYVGNTGNARTTPPHLHFGVYADAGAINPYPLLALHR